MIEDKPEEKTNIIYYTTPKPYVPIVSHRSMVLKNFDIENDGKLLNIHCSIDHD